MGVFDRSTIIGFTQEPDYKIVYENLENLTQLLNNAMEDISKKNPIVNSNFEIKAFNDFYNGAITPVSEIDVFLVIKSPQIELNTTKLVKNKFKSFWLRAKRAWLNTRSPRKRKKRLKKLTEQTVQEQIKGTYNIHSLCIDLVNTISNYISALSVVSTTNASVRIVGDDFTYAINIYPALQRDGYYSVYNSGLNKFIDYDFANREGNIISKFNRYPEKFLNLLRIYNMVYYNIYNTHTDQIYMESLLYNLPNRIFNSDDIYEVFIESINYFNNANLAEFYSVLDNSQMFKDGRIKSSIYDTLSFIKHIKNNL